MEDILAYVVNKDPNEKEFHQAVGEVFESVQPVLDQNPEYRRAKIPERIVEPERAWNIDTPFDLFICEQILKKQTQ